MAKRPFGDSVDCASFFDERVVLNVDYWLNFVASNANDITTLDAERPRIVKAILFALDLEEACSHVQQLIMSFTVYAERRGFWAQWTDILGQAITLAKQNDDMVTQIDLTLGLARLMRKQGDFKAAIVNYRQVIALGRQSRDRFNEARALTNLGYLFIERSHWHRAEILCLNALRIFEQLKSDHGCAHTENHLGLLYTRQESWDKAQAHLAHACEIWRQEKDDYSLVDGLINQGVLYTVMNRPEQALTYLEEALDKAQQICDEVQIGTIHINTAASYRKKGVSAKAEHHAQCARTIFLRLSHLSGVAHANENLALAYIDQQQWIKAKYSLESALETWQQLNVSYGIIRTLIYMVEYELAQNNRSLAIAQLDKLAELNLATQWYKQYPDLMKPFNKYCNSLSYQRQAVAA